LAAALLDGLAESRILVKSRRGLEVSGSAADFILQHSSFILCLRDEMDD
jgi:hypothetical protein